MAWIESHTELEDHPKLFDLAEKMQWDTDLALGKLHRFWYWCFKYAEDGDLTKHNDSRLGRAVGLNGDDCKRFVEAMVSACWLDRKPYFRVHDWWDYAGRYLQGKYGRESKKWESVRRKYVLANNRRTVCKQQTNNRQTTDSTVPNLPNLPNLPTKPDKTPSAHQSLIGHFAKNRGASLDNQAIITEFFKKHGDAASRVLKMASGDLDLAKQAIDEIAPYLDKQVVRGEISQWANLAAIANKFIEWKSELDKENESKCRSANNYAKA